MPGVVDQLRPAIDGINDRPARHRVIHLGAEHQSYRHPGGQQALHRVARRFKIEAVIAVGDQQRAVRLIVVIAGDLADHSRCFFRRAYRQAAHGHLRHPVTIAIGQPVITRRLKRVRPNHLRRHQVILPQPQIVLHIIRRISHQQHIARPALQLAFILPQREPTDFEVDRWIGRKRFDGWLTRQTRL